MPIEQEPLRPIRVDYKCDKCGDGCMRPTGTVLMSDPPKYEHRCQLCGARQNFTHQYPTIMHAPEGELLNPKHLEP